MSEMIERVSRAYDPEVWVNIDMTAGRDDLAAAPWKLTRKHCLERARAAIEAMREPTIAMEEAGAKGSGEDSINVARGAYQSMIDEALKP